MTSVVGVWLGEVAKFGRPEAAHPAAGAEVGGRRHGEERILTAEGVKKGVVQEKKTTRASGVLSDSEAVVCLLMDRFAPA